MYCRLYTLRHAPNATCRMLEHEGIRLGAQWDSIFRNLCIQCWFLAETNAAGLRDENLLARSIWSFTPHADDQYTSEEGPGEAIQKWVEQDVCNRYDPKSFLERLNVTLRNPDVVGNILSVIAPIIGVGLRAPPFQPLLAQTGIFSSIRKAVDRQCTHGMAAGSMILLNQACLFVE